MATDEKKYMVPEPLIDALTEAGWEDSNVRTCAEFILRWQAENPKVPNSQDQADLLSHWRREDKHYGYPTNGVASMIVEWQRRMYLDQEPEVTNVDCWTSRLRGYTFTQKEAEAICDYVRRASRPGYLAPEPEVPETSDAILKLRQIRYDLAERPKQTSIALVVESLEDVLCSLGDKLPEPKVPDHIREAANWAAVCAQPGKEQRARVGVIEAYRRSLNQ